MKFLLRWMTTQEPLTLNRLSTVRLRPYGSDYDFIGGGKTMLNIGGLKDGIVLDHIEAGRSLDIYYHLGLDKLECQVAIIKMPAATKWGAKILLKLKEPWI